MALSPLRRALRGARHQVRHVTPVAPTSASGPVADVYRALERDFGMLAPPILLHSPAPGPLAASWVLLRESLLADGPVSRADREAVATAVSEENRCPYCVTVHHASRKAAGDARPVAAGEGRGTPEALAVAMTFDYLNRMVNVFLPGSPLPGPAGAAGRALLGRLVVGDRRIAPGASLALLPEAAPSPEPSWAAGKPVLATGFARAGAAFDACGRRAVPPAVRELVTERLAGPGPAGPSRAWVEDDVARLAVADRPAGRLALLTALASYQVDDGVVEALRGDGAEDAALIELTAWAAWTAACRRPGRVR